MTTAPFFSCSPARARAALIINDANRLRGQYSERLARSSAIHGLARRTALLLAHMGASKGYAWPRLTTLIQALACSKRGIINALQELAAAGFVQVVHRGNRGSVYVLPWSSLWHAPETDLRSVFRDPRCPALGSIRPHVSAPDSTTLVPSSAPQPLTPPNTVNFQTELVSSSQGLDSTQRHTTTHSKYLPIRSSVVRRLVQATQTWARSQKIQLLRSDRCIGVPDDQTATRWAQAALQAGISHPDDMSFLVDCAFQSGQRILAKRHDYMQSWSYLAPQLQIHLQHLAPRLCQQRTTQHTRSDFDVQSNPLLTPDADRIAKAARFAAWWRTLSPFRRTEFNGHIQAFEYWLAHENTDA